jgi:hypothetical protein
MTQGKKKALSLEHLVNSSRGQDMLTHNTFSSHGLSKLGAPKLPKNGIGSLIIDGGWGSMTGNSRQDFLGIFLLLMVK